MSRGEINCLAVVQARMGSTRLPGKVLTDIAGRPALWHVIRRLEQCPGVDRGMAAIPEGPEDDALADYAAELGVDCFRGDQDDVLDRIFQAAAPLFPRAVARVTAAARSWTPISWISSWACSGSTASTMRATASSPPFPTAWTWRS